MTVQQDIVKLRESALLFTRKVKRFNSPVACKLSHSYRLKRKRSEWRSSKAQFASTTPAPLKSGEPWGVREG